MLSSVKIINNKSSSCQDRCSRAHLRRLRRLIQETRGLGQATQRRKPAFRSAFRIVDIEALNSKIFGYLHVGCLSTISRTRHCTHKMSHVSGVEFDRSSRARMCIVPRLSRFDLSLHIWCGYTSCSKYLSSWHMTVII